MTPPLRATAIVGIGSLATLALSVVTAKAYALLIGPEGLGVLALMLGLINVVMVITLLGMPISLVRWVAARKSDPGATPSVRSAAMALGLLAGALAAALLVILREPVADLILGSADRSGDVTLLALAVMAGTIGGVQIGILNGEHRVGRVTLVHIGTAVAATLAGIGLVVLVGDRGLAPAFLVTFVVQGALSSAFVRRSGAPAAREDPRPIAVGLVREGVPIAASQLTSAGVLLVVPFIIFQTLGSHDVGQYRAAIAISTGYLSIFLAALTQDFLPRISAAADASEAIELVERRMRLVMGVAIPIILGLLAVGPWLVDLLYSDEFTRAFDVLQWQFIGDLIRLPAWVLGYVLIARARSIAYFGYELSVGVLVVGASLIGINLLGLAGIGLAYAVAQLVMYVVVWWVVRRQLEAAPGRLQLVVVVVATLSSVILVMVSDPILRLVLFGSSAVVVAVIAWPRLSRLHRAGGL